MSFSTKIEAPITSLEPNMNPSLLLPFELFISVSLSIVVLSILSNPLTTLLKRLSLFIEVPADAEEKSS